MKRVMVAAAAALVLAGCATPPPIEKQTASGKAEVLLKGMSPQAARARLLERCAMRGMQVDEQQSTVACSRELQGAAAVMMQLALGNSYSTTPVQKTTFLISQRGEDAFIMAIKTVVTTQMPGGQVKSQDMDHNHLTNTTQQFLDSLAS